MFYANLMRTRLAPGPVVVSGRVLPEASARKTRAVATAVVVVGWTRPGAIGVLTSGRLQLHERSRQSNVPGLSLDH